MKKIFILALIVMAAILIVLWRDPTLRRIVFYNLYEIDDYRIFTNRTLTASQTPFRFKEEIGTGRVPGSISMQGKR